MSAGEERDGEAAASVFVYESKVHCSNVLSSLEEQRRRDVLCDVTVLVEGTEVRAHRAVLAASSRYFLQVLLGYRRSPGEEEPIIYLPDQVTAKGFAPLLQFAYTARLVLSQENIHEVILCADFLGVHNLEDTCFVFLREQMRDDSRQVGGGDVDAVSSEKVSLDDSAKTRQKTDNVANKSSLLADFPRRSKSGMHQDRICDNKHNGENRHRSSGVVSPAAPQTLLPPAGIKEETFAFEEGGGEKTESCTEEVLEMELEVEGLPGHLPDLPNRHRSSGVVSPAAPRTLLPPSGIKEETFVFEEGGGEKTESCTEEVLEMELEVEGVPEHLPDRESPTSCLRSYLQSSGLDLGGVPSAAFEHLLANRLPFDHGRESVKNSHQNKRESLSHVKPADLENSVSKVSRHKAELDRCSVIFSFSAGEAQTSSHSSTDEKFREKTSTLVQIEPSYSGRLRLTNSCPTSSETSPDSPAAFKPLSQNKSFHYSFSNPEDAAGGSSSPDSSSVSGLPCGISGVLDRRDSRSFTPQGCTEIKSEQEFGNSSDESGSFSDGESESGISRVSGPEVNLPFPVDQITNLTRNDFQLLVKMHRLTSEQLEFVHDVRRRSKNRIAARRCRKRKMDCIQNLQKEIRKLVCEKEKLLNERDQLKVCMSDLWQNLAFLSQQVCEEVKGSIQTSNPPSPSSDEDSVQPRPPASNVGVIQRLLEASHPGQELPTPMLLIGSTEEASSLTLSADFCQQLSRKCTTEKQNFPWRTSENSSVQDQPTLHTP